MELVLQSLVQQTTHALQLMTVSEQFRGVYAKFL
jgi:hypothetical protein